MQQFASLYDLGRGFQEHAPNRGRCKIAVFHRFDPTKIVSMCNNWRLIKTTSILTTVILTSVDELFGGSPESSAWKSYGVSFNFTNKFASTYYRHFECVHFSLLTVNEALCKELASVNVDFEREICKIKCDQHTQLPKRPHLPEATLLEMVYSTSPFLPISSSRALKTPSLILSLV